MREAIVLAGGLGTRLRAVVSDLPKPMAPVAGRPFLEHLIEYWSAQGVRRFVVSVGYMAERISGHFGRAWHGAAIAYAREDAQLGTGGGLLLALEQVEDAQVLVLNGDTFFKVGLASLEAFHASRAADCSLSLFRSHDVQRYMGVELEQDGRIRSLAGGATGLANGGVYVMRCQALRALPWRAGDRAGLEGDILPHALRSGWRIYGREFDDAFVDIGVPGDYARASEVMQA